MPVREALGSYGGHLGMAFQLIDDLLGIWGLPEITGKPVYSDLRAAKKSLPVTCTEVVVRLRATLVRTQDRAVMGEQLITSTRRASENRQGPIVQAFEGAVQDVLAKLIAWTRGG